MENRKELRGNKEVKKYGLVWEDNVEEVEEELKYKTPILKEEEELSIYTGEEFTNNLLIEGDNLESLTYLKNEGKKVDVIYIDPPYNSLNADGTFVYKDRRLNKGDSYRHSSWLSFMGKRLKIARELLTEEGVIFISIDDRELYQLKLLCDIIFGEENFIANLIVNVAPAGSQSSKDVAMQQDYCLMYRKTKSFSASKIPSTEEEINNKYKEKDEKGSYYTERIWKRGVGGLKKDVPSLHFPVYYDVESQRIYIDKEIEGVNKHDDNKNIVKIIPYHTIGVLGRWTWSRGKMVNEKDKLIVKKTSGEYKLYKKVYAIDDDGHKMKSLIPSKVGRTELGTLEIKEVMGYKAFQYPKYSGFVKNLIQLHSNKNATVLDFFAGSGTTGHAVLELNKEDGGNRNFILSTNNENNICRDVTYQRMNKVINGYTTPKGKEVEGIPANLKYYKTELVSKEDKE